MIRYQEDALKLLNEGRRIVELDGISPEYVFDIDGLNYYDVKVDRQTFLRLVKRLEIRREGDKSNMWIITDKGRQRYADLEAKTPTPDGAGAS